MLQNKPEVSEIIKGKSAYHWTGDKIKLVYELHVAESKEHRWTR